MKKLMIYAMSILTVFALVGCGAKKEEAPKTEAAATTEVKPEDGAKLIVWESKGPEGEFMAMAAKKFQEKFGVPVQYAEVNMTDALTKLGQDGPSGVGADVFVFPHDRLGEASSAGLVMENMVSADAVKSNFMDAAVTAATKDGKVMAWPLSIETYALFYNKDVLPNGPATFEELLDFGKKFTDKKANKFGIFWEAANGYYGHSFLAMDGGYVFGDNGTNPEDIGINNAGAVKGLDNMLKLKAISAEKSGDINYGTMMGLFQEGKVATMINGPWAIGDLKKANTNYGIVALPTFDGKHLNSFSGVRLMGVSTYSKFPKAAQLFAQFITSDEMLLERFKMTGQIPPVKSLLTAPEIASNGDVKPFLEQAQYATPMPAIAEMKYFWDPVGAALSEAWDGKATAQAALETAVKTMKEAIKAAK
ncbi:MAG: maltose ABC transporter substrate-binding protein [Fusobacteriaceae bacterium]|nr:maltose ABC transporter substrate-binding protein [Fusobacteriaceae bacterium]